MATRPLVALTTGMIYLVGGLCVLAVVLIDPPDQHRFWLTFFPVVAVVCGIITLRLGCYFPRWLFHGCVMSGNVLVTAEIVIGRGMPVVGATMPIYVFVVIDAAFFFSLRGLAFHLAHVLAVTTFLLPAVGVPWQTIVTFNGVLIGVGVVIAYICRIADAVEVDALTGLLNRRGIDRYLEDALKDAEQKGLCLILIDLDGFKDVNDAEGHQIGDEVLVECAARWDKLVPRGIELGRYGGDEFALIAPGWNAKEGMMLAEALRRAVPTGLTASAGVAGWEPEDTAVLLLERADVALYAAKADGRDRTVAYGHRDPSEAPPEVAAEPRPPRLRSV
ncbi:GGDEF domain-containing protein [Nocardioides nematodiphilus]|uniref:GGDEF domain-containing protein n=1 Tax=Nocardioides nematodiphilus TaxID=2849669 RepID=UPI001CD9D585|nr:GGDEF domain-containing protein [Nocardioides nematodiphilus]MCA1982570.1 GGDEF domain-containing protein [Nocardioides nematodiphilus]